MDLNSKLQKLHACSEARAWAASQHGSAYAMWRCCDRGDWLLWLAARAGADRRLVVLAACDCAEVALVHVPKGEERPRIAVETARRWACGKATIEEVRRSAVRAVNAHDDADTSYAAIYAVDAATHAAFAAYATTTTASAAAAAHAVYTATVADAADAADAATYANAKATTLAPLAQLVRARIPWSVVRNALKTA